MKMLHKLLLTLLFFAITTSSAVASETLLTKEQITKLFSDRTMIVTNVNFRTKRVIDRKSTIPQKQSQDYSYRLYTTELGAAHTLDAEGETDVRGWFTDEHDRFCFSRKLNNSKRDQQNTCGQLVWDGKITYSMYKTTKLRQRGDRVTGKNQKDLLLTFSNVGKGNKLTE